MLHVDVFQVTLSTLRMYKIIEYEASGWVIMNRMGFKCKE